MKRLTMILSAALIGVASAAVAADDSTGKGGGPSGPGAVTGDPAASSQNADHDTTGRGYTRSGSGMSSSGGRDDNGDQGRDAMPESNKNVRPHEPGPSRH